MSDLAWEIPLYREEGRPGSSPLLGSGARDQAEALVGGGAGALLVKSGLLQKFGKFLVVGVVALLAALRKLFGKKETSTT